MELLWDIKISFYSHALFTNYEKSYKLKKDRLWPLSIDRYTNDNCFNSSHAQNLFAEVYPIPPETTRWLASTTHAKRIVLKYDR